MFSGLRISCLALLVAFGLAVWHSMAIAVDGPADQQYRQELRSLQVSDTLLRSDLLESRAGIVAHYDDLVRRIAELRQQSKGLSTPPAFVSVSGGQQIERAVIEYSQVLTEQEELIESFKINHAVLRNSLRFFPGEALALAERIAAHPEGQALATMLSDFHSSVLHYYLFSESQLVGSVEKQSVALAEVDSAWLSAEDKNSIELLTRHAAVIMQRRALVDGAISKMLELPSAARVQELYETYANNFSSASDAASRANLVAWLLALASVLASAAYIILRLKRSREALSRATTDLEQALALLGIEKEKHKDLADLKSRFVSMTSHEFRTPLSVVLSSAELLQVYGERWPEEKKQTHLLRVQNAAKYMKQMLDEVLLVGRAEAGKLESEAQAIDVTEFCDDLVETLRHHFQSSQDVAYSCSGDLHDLVIDQQLLMHILDNLLSNAFKYSGPKDKIIFDVCRDGKDLVFTVQDHGIGISAEDQLRLFETFHRGANVGEVSGTGLGLAVVKKSVDVLKGSISVTSELGRGSTFVVRIPAPTGGHESLRDSA